MEGIYRNGRVEFLEDHPQIDQARVFITFIPAAVAVDLIDRGIDEQHTTDFRARLSSFYEDWNRPDMDIYEEV